MSVFASTTSGVFTEDRLFDECSDPNMSSMQPSDEWEESYCVNNESQFDGEVSPEREQDGINVDDSQHSIHEPTPSCRVEQSNTTNNNSTQFSRQSTMMDNLYDTSDQSFVSYLSHLVPIKMMTMNSMSFGTSSPETHAKVVALPEQKLKTQRTGSSSNSRCIIENTESIKDRRDEHKQQSRSGRGEGEDCDRDQHQNHHHHDSCSVEEISQISELTMDIHTVVMPEPAEHKFASCATLPTISEVKRFESTQIASCTAGAMSVKDKARCSGESNSNKCTSKCDKNGGNSNDMIDFVFELVEDALCTSVTRSKAERKKFFMEAFQEESEKAVKIKTASSKHNRSNNSSTTKSRRSSSRSRHTTTAQTANTTKSSTNSTGEVVAVKKLSRSEESMSDEINKVFMVDKSPGQTPESILPRTNSAPVDEDQTLDWSKMMSLAEKQLEAEEVKSIYSSFSGIAEKQTVSVSKTESKNGGSRTQNLEQQDVDDAAAASLLSTSSRTPTTVASDVVKGLRELSAFDSSSFDEEETPRFLLTSLLFGFMRRRLVDQKSDDQDQKQEQEVVDELYENCSSRAIEIEDTVAPKNNTTNQLLYVGPREEEFSEERIIIKTFHSIVFTQRIIFQAIRYILFIVYFIFWPSGIPRRKIKNQPLKRKSKEPSLLELVCKN